MALSRPPGPMKPTSGNATWVRPVVPHVGRDGHRTGGNAARRESDRQRGRLLWMSARPPVHRPTRSYTVPSGSPSPIGVAAASISASSTAHRA